MVAGNSENLTFIGPKRIDAVITDPPYFANVMYSELADFFYVWLRLGLKNMYPWFEPERSWRDEEIVMNEKLGKTSDAFIKGLTRVFKQCHTVLKDKGILLFTFHHNKLWSWEHIANMLLDTGFYVSSCLIVRSEGKSGYHSSLGNVKYDACIVCRKRQSAPSAKDWSTLVTKIKDHSSIWVDRIRKSGMTVNYVDLIVVVMGKFLEFYTKHWPKVTSGAETVDVHRAIEDMKPILSELMTYRRDEEETRDFIPSTAEVVTPPKIRAREYPKYRKDWKTRLEWVNAGTRALISQLIERVESELPEVFHIPKHRWYYFYKGKSQKLESLFAVLTITKRKVHIRMGVDPSKFSDRKNITKPYKRWFFKTRGQERDFSINKPEQLDYALELLQQAYSFARGV